MSFKFQNEAWPVVRVESGGLVFIHGTSFPLVGPYFMTASHVLAEAQTSVTHEQEVMLFRPNTAPARSKLSGQGFAFDVVADWDDLDVALLLARDTSGSPLNLAASPSQIVTDFAAMVCGNRARAVGFPHITPDEFFYRTLQGFVTADRAAGSRPPNVADSTFVCELSFECPKGLSGAALRIPVSMSGQTYSPIVGVVIGNVISELYVARESVVEETTEHDGGRCRETFEEVTAYYTRYGVAVGLEQILGRSIGDGRTLIRELERHGLQTIKTRSSSGG